MPVTRLAPSPTGALHLGNACTFLINWLLARQSGWRVILRIEDLDRQRVKPAAGQQAIDDLRWLGLDWDDGPIYQSQRQQVYADATAALLASGQAYACVCSRKEVEQAASAPHAEDGVAVYPGTCRGRFATPAEAEQFARRPPAVRFYVPAGRVDFTDDFCGEQSFDVHRLGDFVIARADRVPAYQLAVVVDDAAMGVTHVVRGDDLLDSTPRQILLYRALKLEAALPRYYHLPLVVDDAGRRLAKRHGDTCLFHLRSAGVDASRVRALLARWMNCSIGPTASMNELLARFSLDQLPKQPIVFTPADREFLFAR